MKNKVIYVIGSLRNENIPVLSNKIRELFPKSEVFDDWHSVSPNGDDLWKDYEMKRGRTYEEALSGWHAHNVFNFDKKHIDRADIGILVMPAGKSAFLELGYMIGQGKPGFILMDNQDRWDVMLLFANKVVFNEEDLLKELKKVI